MSGNVEFYALPPAVQRIVSSFRMSGRISFWGQAVLGVISLFILFFANLVLRFDNQPAGQPVNNPGSGVGFFFALLGILALFAGAYWAFQYIRLSRKLQSKDTRSIPQPGELIQALRIGLIINLVGMLLTLLGSEALIGSLVAKAFSQPQGGGFYYERITQAIQPIDIWIIQANINTVLAHFIGLVASLWLVRSMSR